jgi:hypothetical protein
MARAITARRNTNTFIVVDLLLSNKQQIIDINGKSIENN